MSAGFKQQASGSTFGGNSVTVTLPSPTTTGNALLVIWSCFYSTYMYTSIVDNASPASSFTPPPGDVHIDFQGATAIASALNITGRSGHAVTVSLNANYYVVTVIEVEGLLTSGAFDQSFANATLAANYTSGLTGTIAQADEYLIGAHAIDNPNTLTAVPATGWVSRGQAVDPIGSGHRIYIQDRVVSSPTTPAAYQSNGTADSFDKNVIATYKLATGGPTPITGTLTRGLDDLTVASGLGTVKITGVTPTLALDLLTVTSGQGTVKVSATLTAPLDLLTAAGVGVVGLAPILGSLAATPLAPLTLSLGQGTARVTGVTPTLTLDLLTVSGTGLLGVAPVNGSLTTLLAPLTVVSSAGIVTLHGALSPAALAPLTLSAHASASIGAPISGNVTQLLAPLIVYAAGRVAPLPADCAVTTLGDLQTLMAQRWDGVVFWTPEEARLALNEALREWNLLTGTWRTRTQLRVTVSDPEVPLPGAMTYGMRVATTYPDPAAGLHPLTPTSLSELDLGRPSWRLETTASGGDVPARPLLWAPLSLTRIAIWPTLAITSGSSLWCDGVLSTPVLSFGYEPINLGEEIIDTLVDMALHIVAFKEGGARWRATRPFFEAFLQAAAEENAILKTNQRYRRFAGLDRRRDLQPSTGAANQISGVATQFSRHDQPAQGGGA